MDNEQAKFILGAARASGADNTQPDVAEALSHARGDPALSEWLERERVFDVAVAKKMAALEPPPGLRAQIIAGGRVSRRRREWKSLTWGVGMGLAASLLMVVGLTTWLRHATSRNEVVAQNAPLYDWQRSCVGVFSNPLFSLDFEDPSYPTLEAHLIEEGAPIAGELPFNNEAIARSLGCKVLGWRGHTVSLACFVDGESGQLVHLFVMKRGATDEAAFASGDVRAQVGAYSTVTWLKDDLVVMVASKLPAEKLERVLAHDVTLAALPAVAHDIAS